MTDPTPQKPSTSPNPTTSASPPKPPSAGNSKERVVDAVSTVMINDNKTPDLGKKPSDMKMTKGYWLQLARKISGALGLQIPDSESEPYFDKQLSAYCEFLEKKLA